MPDSGMGAISALSLSLSAAAFRLPFEVDEAFSACFSVAASFWISTTDLLSAG
jgi:hypothetical protein